LSGTGVREPRRGCLQGVQEAPRGLAKFPCATEVGQNESAINSVSVGPRQQEAGSAFP
jgi:hypothetical protein